MLKKQTIKRTKKIIKIVAIVFIVFILGCILLQKITNNKFSLFGFGMYTVVSESMMPRYEIGDMIFTRKVAEKDLKKGDDVVYLGKVGDLNGRVITHEIQKINSDGTIITKGINNNAADPAIEYSQIYGKVVKKLVLLSIFSKLMNNSVLFYIIIFVPFSLLFFFDIKQIMKDKEALEKEKNKAPEEENTQNKE